MVPNRATHYNYNAKKSKITKRNEITQADKGIFTIRDRLQISLLLLTGFKRIDFNLSDKSSENLWFSDRIDFNPS